MCIWCRWCAQVINSRALPFAFLIMTLLTFSLKSDQKYSSLHSDALKIQIKITRKGVERHSVQILTVKLHLDNKNLLELKTSFGFSYADLKQGLSFYALF